MSFGIVDKLDIIMNNFRQARDDEEKYRFLRQQATEKKKQSVEQLKALAKDKKADVKLTDLVELMASQWRTTPKKIKVEICFPFASQGEMNLKEALAFVRENSSKHWLISDVSVKLSYAKRRFSCRCPFNEKAVQDDGAPLQEHLKVVPEDFGGATIYRLQMDDPKQFVMNFKLAEFFKFSATDFAVRNETMPLLKVYLTKEQDALTDAIEQE